MVASECLLIHTKWLRRKKAEERLARAEHMRGTDRGGTRAFDAREKRMALSDARAFVSGILNALPGGRGSSAPLGKFDGHVRTRSQEMGFTSCRTTNCDRRRGSIRKSGL